MQAPALRQRGWQVCAFNIPIEEYSLHRDEYNAALEALSSVEGVEYINEIPKVGDWYVNIEVEIRCWREDDSDEGVWDAEDARFPPSKPDDGDKEFVPIPIPPPSPKHPTELYLVLTYENYDLIKSGEKTTEFREYSEYYVKKILANQVSLRTVKFQRGYGGGGRPKPEQMIFDIAGISLYCFSTRKECPPDKIPDGFIPDLIALDLGARKDI